MKTEALISVVVTVYNLEQYLPECLDSILNQTYRELEILVVDDGSTDGSASICDEYAKKDSRVRVFHERNGGVSAARNKGIEEARGDYIGFIDGDDTISEQMYELLLFYLKKENADVAFGSLRRSGRTYEDGEQVRVLSGGEVMDAFVDGGYRPHIEKSVCDKLFTRAVIGDTRFWVGKRSEDAQFTMVIMSRCRKCVYVEAAKYLYRDDREQNFTTTRNYQWFISDKIPVLQDQLSILKNMGRQDLRDRQESVYYTELIRFYVLIYASEEQESVKKKQLEYLRQLAADGRQEIKRLCGTPYGGWKYRVKTGLFLAAPGLYAAVMKRKCGQ